MCVVGHFLPYFQYSPSRSPAVISLFSSSSPSSFQLLTLLLENNPYMGCLDPIPYVEKVKELEAYLKTNMPSDLQDAMNAQLKEIEESKDDETSGEEIESAALAAAIAETEEASKSDNLSESQLEYLAKVKALKFSSSALAFTPP